MKTLIVVAVALLALSVVHVNGDLRRLICYFEKTDPVAIIDPHLCTHIIYDSVTPLATGHVVLSGVDKVSIPKFLALKKINADVKLMVTFGGPTVNQAFYKHIGNNTAARATFEKNLIAWLKTSGFDGFEFNDEASQAVTTDSILLYKEIRKQTTGLIFSVLTQDYGDWSQLALNVDIINLHTYDFTSSTTSFSSCIGSEDTKSIKGTVENCKNAEIDLSKLNVGIPFHGIGFRLKDPSKHELNNAIINGSQFELPYSKICLNKWSSVMDIDDQGLYAFSGNKWISYDNEEMVKIKSEYIIDNDIGGAMAASINSDDVEGKCGKGTFPLLRTIAKLMEIPEFVPITTTTIKTTKTTTTKTTTSKPGPYSCKGLANGWGYKDPTDCSKYFVCQLGVPHSKTCPAGLKFNQSIQRCSSPDTFNC